MYFAVLLSSKEKSFQHFKLSPVKKSSGRKVYIFSLCTYHPSFLPLGIVNDLTGSYYYFVTFNYLIDRDLTIEEPVGYPHQKRKKTSLSSFLPALQGERCARAGICCVVERESSFECTGFSFHDFADSLSRLAQRTSRKE